MLQKLKHVYAESLLLLLKNPGIYCFGFLLVFLPHLLPTGTIPTSLLNILAAFLGFGWLGTKIALLKDAHTFNSLEWRKTKEYFWKYFKIFSPLILLYFVIGVIFVVFYFIAVLKNSQILSSTEVTSDQVINTSLESTITGLLQHSREVSLQKTLQNLPLYAFQAGYYFFIVLLVLKEQPFIKTIPLTITTIRKHLFFYLSVLWLVTFLGELQGILISLLNITFFPLEFALWQKIIIYASSTLVDLYLTTCVLIYFLPEKK